MHSDTQKCFFFFKRCWFHVNADIKCLQFWRSTNHMIHSDWERESERESARERVNITSFDSKQEWKINKRPCSAPHQEKPPITQQLNNIKLWTVHHKETIKALLLHVPPYRETPGLDSWSGTRSPNGKELRMVTGDRVVTDPEETEVAITFPFLTDTSGWAALMPRLN